MLDNAASNGRDARIGIIAEFRSPLSAGPHLPIDDRQSIGDGRPGEKVRIIDEFVSMGEVVHKCHCLTYATIDAI